MICTECEEDKPEDLFQKTKIKDKIYYLKRCRKCQYIRIKANIDESYRERNRKSSKESYKKYREKRLQYKKDMKERDKPIIEAYREKNREIIKFKRIEVSKLNKKEESERQKRYMDKLPDSYIIRCLKMKTKLSYETIKENKELIELKRLQIKLGRLCRTLKN